MIGDVLVSYAPRSKAEAGGPYRRRYSRTELLA